MEKTNNSNGSKTEELRLDLNSGANQMTALNSSKKKKYSIISIKNKKKKDSKDTETTEVASNKKKKSFPNSTARGSFISAREITDNLKSKGGAETTRDKTFRSLPNITEVDTDISDDSTNSSIPSISPSSPPSPPCESKENNLSEDYNKRMSLPKIFTGNNKKKKTRKLTASVGSNNKTESPRASITSQFPPPPAHFIEKHHKDSKDSKDSKKRSSLFSYTSNNQNNNNYIDDHVNNNRNSVSFLIQKHHQNNNNNIHAQINNHHNLINTINMSIQNLNKFKNNHSENKDLNIENNNHKIDININDINNNKNIQFNHKVEDNNLINNNNKVNDNKKENDIDNNNNDHEKVQEIKVTITKTRITENENELSVVVGDDVIVTLPPIEGWCWAVLNNNNIDINNINNEDNNNNNHGDDDFVDENKNENAQGYIPIDVSAQLLHRFGQLENVDISSLIEYKEENKCTLGKNLENRPEIEELIDRNILTESSSPYLNEQRQTSASNVELGNEIEDDVELSPEALSVRLFSTKPHRGIEKLIEYQIVENSPQSIANYLFHSRLLPRDVVGNYLGDPGDFINEIRNCYLDHLNFAGMEFDKALRVFLYNFKLPGEAQKIDRIMQSFSRKYFTQYSGNLFSHEDTVYILAYATIMLNTDLHNPYVKKKMTQAEFIHNNRDIDQGKNLPLVFLQDLYQRILEDEIKTRNDEVIPKAIKRGYLMMMKKKKLNRYWFVLDKDTFHLYYFTHETDTKPIQSYNLQFINIKKQAISRKKKKYFTILLEYKDGGKAIEVKLLTPSQRLWVEWLTCIGDCIQDGKS